MLHAVETLPGVAVPGHRARRWVFCRSIAVALFVLLGPTSVHPQSIDIDRLAYRHDERLVVPYTFSSRWRSKSLDVYNRVSRTGVGKALSGAAEWKPSDLSGTIEVDLSSFLPSVPFLETIIPISILLWDGTADGTLGPPTAEKHIYVVNPVKPLPGSMSLPPGPFVPGQQIEVRINKPEAEAKYLESAWQLVFYRYGARLDSGTVLLAGDQHRLISIRGSGESSHILTLPPIPGRHELQLRDEGGFIVERLPVDIVPAPTAALSAGEDGTPVAGGQTDILTEGRAFHPLKFEILEPGPRDGWTPAYESELTAPLEAPSPPSHAVQSRAASIHTPYPGARRLVASWDMPDHSYGDVVAGILDYTVVPPPDGMAPQMPGPLVSQAGVFFPGEPIDIAIDSLPSGVPPEGDIHVYRLRSAEGSARQEHAEGAEPVKTLPVAGVPFRATITDALAPGDYGIAFVSAPRGNWPPAVMDAGLTVLPPAGEFGIAVNEGGPVYAARPLAIDLTVPDPSILDDSRFWVALVHLGGTLPDCQIVLEHASVIHRLGPGTSGRIAFGDWPPSNRLAREGDHLVVPGDYEARIYFGDVPGHERNFWPRATLVAATPFTVTYQAAPGALVLETADPTEGEDVFIRLRLPPELLRSVHIADLGVQLVRQSELAESGVERLSVNGSISLTSADDSRSVVQIRADMPDQLFRLGADQPRFRPGPYELRLVEQGFCFLGDCRQVLLDRLAFTIRHETWRGPIALALAPGDLAPERLRDGFARMDPPGICGDESEKMVLSFSRPLDGKPVPLEGPVDYGDAFYVEGRLETPARRPVYRAQLETAAGDRQEVLLYPTEDDPTLLRSDLSYVMWDVRPFAASGPTPGGRAANP